MGRRLGTRVLTLHVEGLRLTPEIVVVMEAISLNLGKPEMAMRTDGLAFYVQDYSNLI